MRKISILVLLYITGAVMFLAVVIGVGAAFIGPPKKMDPIDHFRLKASTMELRSLQTQLDAIRAQAKAEEDKIKKEMERAGAERGKLLAEIAKKYELTPGTDTYDEDTLVISRAPRSQDAGTPPRDGAVDDARKK